MTERAIYFPTVQGQLVTGHEPSVRIDVAIKDIRCVLVNAMLAVQVYRDSGNPDAALEDAIERIAQRVALVDIPHANGAA